MTKFFVNTKHPAALKLLSILVMLLINHLNLADAYFKCTKDGFFPDKTDCWVYHICDGGTHTVRACDEDLFFNSKTGLCDWPMNVECKQPHHASNKKPASSSNLSKSTVSSKSTANTPTTVTINESSSETTSNSGNSSSGSLVVPSSTALSRSTSSSTSAAAHVEEETSGDSENEMLESLCSKEDYGYIAYPKDCRRYIYCQEGTAKVFACQGGLLWKQADGNCVWPLDSDCATLKRPTTSTSSSLSVNGGVPSSAQYLATLRENYGTIDCPSADVIGFFPNPYDCSAYHFCNGGKDQVILCEPGLFYRQDKQVCDWPQNSNCHAKCPSASSLLSSLVGGQNQMIMYNGNTQSGAGPSGRHRFLDTKSCCRYLECINGQLVTQVCQYPLQFDVHTKQW
jgi:chitinase